MAAPLAGLPDFLLYGQVLVQIGRRGLYGVLKTPGQKLGLKLHLDKDIKLELMGSLKIYMMTTALSRMDTTYMIWT